MLKRVFKSRSRDASDNEAKAGVVSNLERQYGGPTIVDSNSSIGPVNDGRPVVSPGKIHPDLPYGQTNPGFAYEAYTPPEGETLVGIWVEKKSLALFELPVEVLSKHSLEFRHALATPPDPNPHIFTPMDENQQLCIENVSVGQFFDFAQWITRHGKQVGQYRILDFHHKNIDYAISGSIARLIGDLTFGLAFQSNSFQNAVIQDLYAVLPAHQKPEYIVGRLFEATEGWSLPPDHPHATCEGYHITRTQQFRAAHPAKRLLVEMCEFKIGKGPHKRPLIDSIIDGCSEEVAKEFRELFEFCSWQMRPPGEAFKPVEAFMLDE